jgi:hypothetical protein
VGEAGNGTVYFQVLSHAGTITIAAITDPAHFPELGALTEALRAELYKISRDAATPRRPPVRRVRPCARPSACAGSRWPE